MTEKTSFIESWTTDHQLNELTQMKRYDEYVHGVVRSIVDKTVTVKDEETGANKTKRVEYFLVALRNGAIGYCPTEKFAARTYKNYRRFVGLNVNFAIESIDLENRILVLNGKVAQEKSIELFMQTLKELEATNSLHEHRFKGIVTGKNDANTNIYVSVEGKPCFMRYSQWSWNIRDVANVQEGDEIEVVVRRFDKEQGIVEVSRRMTLPDPFEFLERLEKGDYIAGKITEVHPIRGIYVQVENGLDVKGRKIKDLEEPSVGDIVTCRVQQPLRRELKNGRQTGRVMGQLVIVGYPKGKRVKKDLGSFLFD